MEDRKGFWGTILGEPGFIVMMDTSERFACYRKVFSPGLRLFLGMPIRTVGSCSYVSTHGHVLIPGCHLRVSGTSLAYETRLQQTLASFLVPKEASSGRSGRRPGFIRNLEGCRPGGVTGHGCNHDLRQRGPFPPLGPWLVWLGLGMRD